MQERARLEGVCWPPTARDAPRRSLPHIRGRVRSPQVYDAHKVNAWTDDVTQKAVDALVRSRTRGSAPPRRPCSSRRRRSTASPVSRSVARSEISRRISSTWSRASCCRSEARGSTARPWRLGTRKAMGPVQFSGACVCVALTSLVGERGFFLSGARSLAEHRENRSIICLLTAFATAI